MLAFIGALILGIIVTATVIVAYKMLNDTATEDATNSDEKYELLAPGWRRALAAGILAFAVCWVSKLPGNLAGLGFVALVVMLAASYQICIWWKEEGAYAKEMIPFIILAFLFWFLQKSAAHFAASLIEHQIVRSLLTTIPNIVLVLSLGFFVGNTFFFWEKVAKKEPRRLMFHVGGVATVIVTALILIGVITSCFS